MSIALNMIVGPFAEPFIVASIASCRDLVDEYVFVDTAPGNNPSRLMLDHLVLNYSNVKIIDMPRGEDRDFSFAVAREVAKQHTDSEWILRLDADEILHEDTINEIKRLTEKDPALNFNAIEVAFYHFMVYPWLFQYIEPKTILFRKEKMRWAKGVHECAQVLGKTLKRHDILFYHYGYCRGQAEVFKRWKLYTDITGHPNWYNNTDPNTILEDRIPVCQNFTGSHPQVVQGVLNDLFKDVTPFQMRQIPRYSMSDNHVGLLLITYNDAENLPVMIDSLERTVDYDTHIQIIDMGSTDSTIDILHQWIDKYSPNFKINSIDLSCWTKLHSLSKTMNVGFKSLMTRQECNFIGWIHPDMEFQQPGWLSELVATLVYHPEIGKVCSFNTRDGNPVDLEFFDGQEQAYLIRRGTLLQIGLFDESFIGIGGYEDWDLNNRIRQEGLKVVIAPKSQVWHKGMATRERRDTTDEQVHNSGVYIKKWGTHKEWVEFT